MYMISTAQKCLPSTNNILTSDYSLSYTVLGFANVHGSFHAVVTVHATPQGN